MSFEAGLGWLIQPIACTCADMRWLCKSCSRIHIAVLSGELRSRHAWHMTGKCFWQYLSLIMHNFSAIMCTATHESVDDHCVGLQLSPCNRHTDAAYMQGQIGNL